MSHTAHLLLLLVFFSKRTCTQRIKKYVVNNITTNARLISQIAYNDGMNMICRYIWTLFCFTSRLSVVVKKILLSDRQLLMRPIKHEPLFVIYWIILFWWMRFQPKTNKILLAIINGCVIKCFNQINQKSHILNWIHIDITHTHCNGIENQNKRDLVSSFHVVGINFPFCKLKRLAFQSNREKEHNRLTKNFISL